MNPTIPQILESFITHHGPEKNVTIAYSGGVDSHVLLHALASLKIPLKAIHVNHRISPHAYEWAQHCERVCKTLNIDLKILSVDVPRDSRDGLEGAARKKRYEAIGTYLTKNDFLLTGHHQDDQAETVLLQLFRGTGLKGLAAMPVLKQTPQFMLARPLLNVSRADILKYATDNKLSWIDDESNADETLRRNFLRHDVLPKLQNVWPGVNHALAQTAEHCAEAQNLIRELLEESLQKRREGDRLDVRDWRSLSLPKQHALLRAWLSEQGAPSPSAVNLDRIIDEVILASPGAKPLVQWGAVTVQRVEKHFLFLTGIKKAS